MSEISKARQALRDYARSGVKVNRTDVVFIEGEPDALALALSHGELAGKTYVALQAALSYIEEERAKHKSWAGDPASDSVILALDEIEDAIAKALS